MNTDVEEWYHIGAFAKAPSTKPQIPSTIPQQTTPSRRPPPTETAKCPTCGVRSTNKKQPPNTEHHGLWDPHSLRKHHVSSIGHGIVNGVKTIVRELTSGSLAL